MQGAVWFEFAWVVLATSGLVAWLGILVFRALALRIGWVDRPDTRKAHLGEVPLIGGWAIFVAMLVSLWPLVSDASLPWGWLAGASLLFLVSVADDRTPIRARYRFAVQVIAAAAAVLAGGAQLLSPGHWWPGEWALPPIMLIALSTLVIVTLVNAVNFSDGIDGLCGGLSFVAFAWLVVLVLALAAGLPEGGAGSGRMTWRIPLLFAASAMGALIAFLGFNLRTPWRARASIFLGDGGSTLLGFSLAWLTIHATTLFAGRGISPVVGLWIMAVPLLDAASCIVRRVASGVTPMTADRKHLHHLLARTGLSIGQTAAAMHLAAFASGLVGVGGWWLGVSDGWLLAAFLALLAVFIVDTIVIWRVLDAVDAGRAAGVSSPEGAQRRGCGVATTGLP